MDHEILLIFPNQLYNKAAHPKFERYHSVYLLEEPLFFFDSQRRPLTYHKVKLAYLVTCMKTYHSLYPKINYISYEDMPVFYKTIKGKHLTMVDPMDHDVISKYKDISQHITVLPSKSFMLTHENLVEFHKPGKSVLHAQFFKFVKNKLVILVDQPSTDKENQHPLPSSIKIPNVPRYNSKHHEHAITYVDKHWPNNPGSCEGLTLWPTTHRQATSHLKNFLQHRFSQFGTYQDAIHPEESFLFHSTISPMLNIGLLTPQQVVEEAITYSRKHGIPMNSLEGFLRQLIGWREYMRYLYVFHHQEYMSYPIPKEKQQRITDWNAWYTGQTSFPIVNAEIQKCITVAGGYAHHIIRLMVFMNIFLLLRIHPEDIYKWFMEVCAIDAYDWVMKPNIYCMGYFYPKAMSRQYISTSNYVTSKSSSRYKRDPQWDKLFHTYVKEFRPPAYLRNLKPE